MALARVRLMRIIRGDPRSTDGDHELGVVDVPSQVVVRKIKLIKCGKTSLITDAEALSFQAAVDAGQD